jgi:alpha-tubulin suppressor-like RCC1 family protein
MRASFVGLVVLSFGLCFGCGDDGATPVDAGPGEDSGFDAGPPPVDAGRDARSDAGPVGCTADCELEELALGLDFTCVRRASGEIRCWGANHFGQLGDGDMRHGMECTLAEETDPVDCTGPVTNRVANAVQISAKGAFSACALDADDAVWCWGWQGVPEAAGSDTLRKRYTPEMMELMAAATDVSDGWLATCAVVGGEVWCISENNVGQAGVGNTTEVRAPAMVMGLSGIVDVDVGVFSQFACARSATEVLCWGSNESGQLGDGLTDHGTCMRSGMAGTFDCATTPVPVPVLNALTDEVTQLALGSRHACVLTSAGTVYCWGENAIGQLGQGDNGFTGAGEPVQVPGLTGVTQVAAGAAHTCALMGDGTIQCWGAHNEGQLGDGVAVNDHDDACPFRATTLDCSDSPVTVVGIDDATFIAAGDEHTCAIRGTDQVWCWGINDRLQLAAGGGDRERRVEPVMVLGIDDY